METRPTATDARNVVFDLRVLVHGCSNIPHHTNARVHCKWKLISVLARNPSRSGVLSSVETTTANLAAWDKTIDLPGCVFRVDTESMLLEPTILRLSIRQENRSVLQGFIRLGIVQIDLAEFAGQNTTDRTYLLAKARLNSTLSVTVYAEQVGGDVMFRRRGSATVDGNPTPEDSHGLLWRSKTTVNNTMRSRRTTRSQSDSNPHSIYQVVGDILRMSEESRTGRYPSHVEVSNTESVSR